jgi:starvation-inducible outer membrane lipoprotein
MSNQLQRTIGGCTVAALLLGVSPTQAADSPNDPPAPASVSSESLVTLEAKSDRRIATSSALTDRYLDTTSRRNVQQEWKTTWDAPGTNLSGSKTVPIGWTGGDIGTCQAGQPSTEYLQAMIGKVNAYRRLSGVSDTVQLDAMQTTRAQAAALMLSANNAYLTPSPAAACYSTEAHIGYQNSSMYWGGTGFEALDQFMFDMHPANNYVGNRMLMLNPRANYFGVGSVPAMPGHVAGNALFNSLQGSAVYEVREPEGIMAWPPRGFIPYQLVGPRWSFKINMPGTVVDFTQADVKMKRGGSPIPAPIVARNQPGFYNLVFTPMLIPGNFGFWPRPNGEDIVDVEVSNVLIDGVTTTYRYSVNIYDPLSPTVNAADLGGHQTLVLQVGGRGNVPITAVGAVLNLTVTNPVLGGYVTAFPCGGTPPNASNINFLAGDTRANLAAVRLDEQGRICIYTDASTDVIADVSGYYGNTGDTFVAVDPQRIFDSRQTSKLVSGESKTIQVSGNGGIQGQGVTSVVFNLTVTNPATSGYATMYPCGGAVPNVSSLNFRAGETRANMAAVKLDGTGKVCVYSSSIADVIIDVAGFFNTSGSGFGYAPVNPARILDTRGSFSLLPAGSVSTLLVGGRAGVSTSASAVVLNMTVTRSTSSGYLTLFPCGSAIPIVSNLNFSQGETTANLATVKLDATGNVCVYTSADTHVIADVAGFYAGTTSDPESVKGYRDVSPERLLDTRTDPR